MPISLFNDKIRLESARRVLSHVGEKLDARFSVRLWDGSMVPLGKNAGADTFISINGPQVIKSAIEIALGTLGWVK